MNLLLVIITVVAVSIMLSESTQVKNWISRASSMFYKPHDNSLDFLLGIDQLAVTQEEVDEFKKFLLSSNQPAPAPNDPEPSTSPSSN